MLTASRQPAALYLEIVKFASLMLALELQATAAAVVTTAAAATYAPLA
jgi:hypothetical protein